MKTKVARAMSSLLVHRGAAFFFALDWGGAVVELEGVGLFGLGGTYSRWGFRVD